jgi:hypothetical protein
VGNPSPHAAREAKARKRLDTTDPGDFQRLKAKLWALICLVEETIAETGTVTAKNVRTVYALTQVASVYTKIHEIGELESRVAALEATTKGKRS